MISVTVFLSRGDINRVCKKIRLNFRFFFFLGITNQSKYSFKDQLKIQNDGAGAVCFFIHGGHDGIFKQYFGKNKIVF